MLRNELWYSSLPVGWSVKKFKYVASLYTGNSIKDSEKDNYTDKRNARPYIATKHIEADNNKIDYENGLYVKHNDASFRIAKCGSTLMCVEGGSAGKKKGFLTQDVSFVNKLCCFEPNFRINSKYLFYYLVSPNYEEDFKTRITGLIGGVSVSELLNMSIITPPLSEQQAIADYLDETCSKIDEIIAEAKASIDEYKELKQSVIYEAVTRGLDKNAEMKDSENLAIGKIPKHWVKAKVKNVVTRITVGVVVTPANYFSDAGTVAFLRGINVKEYVINSEPMMYITEETNKELSKTIVHTNDLVIVRDGAIGVTAVVPAKYDGANVVSMIIVSLGSEYNHDYLCYVLNSYVGKIQFNLTKIGSALSHTSVLSVSNIEIPKPSIDEQINIVNYLKEQHKKYNSLITEKQSLIADLEAYKKSLIYEVVTGKRKVV